MAQMNLADCYQVLGLEAGCASLENLKSAYHRLARQYHPDVNPDNHESQEKFMAVSEAYQHLLQLAHAADGKLPKPDNLADQATNSGSANDSSVKVKVQTNQGNSNLSPEAIALKQEVFRKLQELYHHQRYDLAVSLVESLAERMFEDTDVKQWQAIAYQKMGRELAARRQFQKARLYLKQALKADPKNPILWTEVDRDFRYIERHTGLS
jgi:tetratricopeptide (TPR) repeat protein